MGLDISIFSITDLTDEEKAARVKPVKETAGVAWIAVSEESEDIESFATRGELIRRAWDMKKIAEYLDAPDEDVRHMALADGEGASFFANGKELVLKPDDENYTYEVNRPVWFCHSSEVYYSEKDYKLQEIAHTAYWIETGRTIQNTGWYHISEEMLVKINDHLRETGEEEILYKSNLFYWEWY